MSKDYLADFQSLTQTVEDIINKKILSLQVVQSTFSSISKNNGTLNAIVTTDEESAVRQAEELDTMQEHGIIKGPLHGIPITIKDNIEVAGMRSTASHKPFSNNIPVKDATVVKRLRDAGAIVIGKTNMPELAVDFQTNSPVFGRTNNPWDLNRTPGGSTGGGAAAVSSGMSFLEIGNDLLGSIRIPAHFCGIYGFVPSTNTIPRTGIIPKTASGATFSQMLRIGILGRSIKDIATAFTVVKGPDGKDMSILPVELTKSTTKNTDGLKIAWIDDADGVPVTKTTKKILTSFLDKLKTKGHIIQKINSSELGFKQAKKVFAGLFYPTVGLNIPKLVRIIARIVSKNKYLDLSLKRYIDFENQRRDLIENLDTFLSDMDILICPVTSTPAFLHQTPSRYIGSMPLYKKGLMADGKKLGYGDATTAFTILFSVTGNPVAVIPIGKSEDGLPIGIQIVGKRWSDTDLLMIAEKLTEFAEPIGHPVL